MNCVLVYSGGLDSTVLLYDLLDRGKEVAALSVYYGQRHSRELESAQKICQSLGVEHKVVDISSIAGLFGASSLIDADSAVPDGHYAEMSMKVTVVPNRNMLLLALAGAWAIAQKASEVAYAAHGGDHTIYPDCRPEFVAHLDAALQCADWHSVKLLYPFGTFTKTDIVRRGVELRVPFHETWSCYKGGASHCGACGTCVERQEAFVLGGVVDPTDYLSRN
jgi:7-cyano-7-deazaguanine synthase